MPDYYLKEDVERFFDLKNTNLNYKGLKVYALPSVAEIEGLKESIKLGSNSIFEDVFNAGKDKALDAVIKLMKCPQEGGEGE